MIVQARGLTKVFGQDQAQIVAVNNVNLTIEIGELLRAAVPGLVPGEFPVQGVGFRRGQARGGVRAEASVRCHRRVPRRRLHHRHLTS